MQFDPKFNPHRTPNGTRPPQLAVASSVHHHVALLQSPELHRHMMNRIAAVGGPDIPLAVGRVHRPRRALL